MFHPPGELPPSMMKRAKTYVAPEVAPAPVRVPCAASLAAGSSGSLASSAAKMSPATEPIQPATTERIAEEVLACCV
eukprot:210698-Amphidinium_carterae.1